MSSSDRVLQAGITAVVCSYNGEDRLSEVLAALEGQTGCTDFEVRVVVVDNNSTDGTLAKVKSLAKGRGLPIEVLFEARQGKRFALELALSKVETEFTAIVDDDNIVPKDYFQRIFTRFRSDPKIGFVGVSTYLVAEVEPPVWWDRQSLFYAVGKQAGRSGYLDELGKCSVWGAGMAFRTEIWDEAYSHYCSRLKGRNSVNLVAGEDSELCLLSSLMGYRGYVENDVLVGHRMPAARLDEEYLGRLRWSLGYGAVANQVLQEEWQIRRGQFNPLALYLKRTPQFARLYYWLKVRGLDIRMLLTRKAERVHVMARRAAYRGCLDAVNAKSKADLWSFPFGLVSKTRD